MPAPPKPGALKVPKVEVDGIKDPKLKPPKKKDLKLGLDRSAKDSMDRFSDGPEEPTEKTEALETSIVVDSVLVAVHRSFP